MLRASQGLKQAFRRLTRVYAVHNVAAKVLAGDQVRLHWHSCVLQSGHLLHLPESAGVLKGTYPDSVGGVLDSIFLRANPFEANVQSVPELTIGENRDVETGTRLEGQLVEGCRWRNRGTLLSQRSAA